MNEGTLYGALLGFFGVMTGIFGSKALITQSNYIPRSEKVQRGYVIPDKLSIGVRDLDADGERETIMNYEGIDYLLRLDDSGKPVVRAYELRPAEIVPREE